MHKNILHGDYTSYRTIKQLKLPFEFEYHISADDPVRLVDTFVEEMDLSDLYKTYSRIRKNQATPAQLLKIVLYAAMNNIYSSRKIESACKRDINFMFLLEGAPAPDHATIARFIAIHLNACPRRIMSEMDKFCTIWAKYLQETFSLTELKLNRWQINILSCGSGQ